jgi:glucose-6-phosphate isomerase
MQKISFVNQSRDFDFEKIKDKLSQEAGEKMPSLEIQKKAQKEAEQKILKAIQVLENKSGAGADFLGWLDWPENYDQAEFSKIKNLAEKIKAEADILIVIGIGGSYLGARAVIEALTNPFQNTLARAEEDNLPEIYYAGINMSGEYLEALAKVIENKSVYLNVISKSGTTLEPALAFRFLKKKLEEKYSSEEVAERIICTTDKKRGALKKMSDEEGYQTLVVPDDIGGRYSVLTAVGLLPIAVAGIEIEQLMAGACEGMKIFSQPLAENDCFQYASWRTQMNLLDKKIEIMASYEPTLQYFSEWRRQLFGESEGKEGRGIFPASVTLTADLHSLGQYIQEGQRDIFETVISVQSTNSELAVSEVVENYDRLNYLAGQSIDSINAKTKEATIQAHISGGVPTSEIILPEKNAYYLGQLIYFFEKACAVSAYALGVNPFNQPGVEVYKKNMFELLGREK